MNLPEPPEGLVTYPANRVAALDDPHEACAAIGELREQGFDGDEIFALAGSEGAERLDVSGRHHGLQGRADRLIEHIGDDGGADPCRRALERRRDPRRGPGRRRRPVRASTPTDGSIS